MSTAHLSGGVETISFVFNIAVKVVLFHKSLHISTMGDKDDILLEPCTEGGKSIVMMP